MREIGAVTLQHLLDTGSTVWRYELWSGNIESSWKNVSSIVPSPVEYFTSSAAMRSPEIIDTKDTVGWCGNSSGAAADRRSSSARTLQIGLPT